MIVSVKIWSIAHHKLIRSAASTAMTDKMILLNLHTFTFTFFFLELFLSCGLGCFLTNGINLEKYDCIISVGTGRCMCALIYLQRGEMMIEEVSLQLFFFFEFHLWPERQLPLHLAFPFMLNWLFSITWYFVIMEHGKEWAVAPKKGTKKSEN